jgi:hypothetical protein
MGAFESRMDYFFVLHCGHAILRRRIFHFCESQFSPEAGLVKLHGLTAMAIE